VKIKLLGYSFNLSYFDSDGNNSAHLNQTPETNQNWAMRVNYRYESMAEKESFKHKEAALDLVGSQTHI